MSPTFRNLFPIVIGVAVIIAFVWSLWFGKLPEADFSFNNGTEPQTIDPPLATGNPEGRIIRALFEGLLRHQPEGMKFDPATGEMISGPVKGDSRGNVPMTLVPGMAESFPEVSEDGKIYKFRIRENARWTDGTPFTAHDMVWSWRRMLHPDTASQYAYQLYYLVYGQQYNSATVTQGEHVEVELTDRPRWPDQAFPRGTIKRGILKSIDIPPEPVIPEGSSEKRRGELEQEWRDRWTYTVEVLATIPATTDPENRDDLRSIDWQATGTIEKFARGDERPNGVTKAEYILPDFGSLVGVKAETDRDLVITLNEPTPYFNHLVAFYPLFPVNRRCVEEFGKPFWSKTENIVNNGPFQLGFRRIRDRIRLEKNLLYWNEKIVKLNIIDAMAVESETTSLNMYIGGQIDWSPVVPTAIIPELKRRSDFYIAPQLTTYFYRVNTTRAPGNDIRVRRALNMAIDKRVICERILRAGQLPARSLVPPGIKGYTPAECDGHNITRAKELIREYLEDEGLTSLPKIEILYNTNEAHRQIAELIQQQWMQIGVKAEMKNAEWNTFLNFLRTKEYSVARSAWIADYPDPNTFLDMFVTDGENNQTGWSNKDYDRLIDQAKTETEAGKRMQILHDAEVVLMDRLPILPIYSYVSLNMVNPKVKGFTVNVQDLHPLHVLRVD